MPQAYNTRSYFSAEQRRFFLYSLSTVRYNEGADKLDGGQKDISDDNRCAWNRQQLGMNTCKETRQVETSSANISMRVCMRIIFKGSGAVYRRTLQHRLLEEARYMAGIRWRACRVHIAFATPICSESGRSQPLTVCGGFCRQIDLGLAVSTDEIRDRGGSHPACRGSGFVRPVGIFDTMSSGSMSRAARSCLMF